MSQEPTLNPGPHQGHQHDNSEGLRPGWNRPRPEHVPRPTYWPAVTAAGIALTAWGVIPSLIISGMGLVLFIIGISGWIWELRYGEE